jgi:hypothetical protein
MHEVTSTIDDAIAWVSSGSYLIDGEAGVENIWGWHGCKSNKKAANIYLELQQVIDYTISTMHQRPVEESWAKEEPSDEVPVDESWGEVPVEESWAKEVPSAGAKWSDDRGSRSSKSKPVPKSFARSSKRGRSESPEDPASSIRLRSRSRVLDSNTPAWATFDSSPEAWHSVLLEEECDESCMKELFLLAQLSGEGKTLANEIIGKLVKKKSNPSEMHRHSCTGRS